MINVVATLSQRRKRTSAQLSFSTVWQPCDNIVTTSLWQLGNSSQNSLSHLSTKDFSTALNYVQHIFRIIVYSTEAVGQRFSIKKVFLKMLQSSQEKIFLCRSIFFNKTWGLQYYWRKILAQVFSFKFC